MNTAGGEDDVLARALESFQRDRVRVAVFLDGPKLRAVLDTLRSFPYDIGFFDGRRGRFVPVERTSALDRSAPRTHETLHRREAHSRVALTAARHLI